MSLDTTINAAANTPADPSIHKPGTASSDAGARVLISYNPATGEKLAELPVATEADVAKAIARAREAFGPWSALSPRERAARILKARDIFIARSEQMMDLLVAEAGKSRMDCYPDIAPISEAIEFYAKNAEKFLADQSIGTRAVAHKRVRTHLKPRGVVVSLSSYVYPIETSWGPLIPALIAGNVVINKPSELTPLASLRFREILVEAGVPEGVVQVLVGGPEVGAMLCRDVDYVVFTGTEANGKKVGQACLDQLIPTSLGLNGKDPAIVLEDAYLDRAVHGAVWGAFFNCGQTCVSVERCYVVESVYDAFVEGAIELTRKLRQGIDNRFDVDLGCMISEERLAFVDDQVREAVAKGATLRTGGRKSPNFPNGAFYEPTILTDVNHDMRIMVEETCGPVLPIMKVRDLDEAVHWANQSKYGLNSSVYTRDLEKGRRVAERLQVGVCNINECMVQYCAPEAPFNATKGSGIGGRKGAAAIRRFCHEQTHCEDIFNLKREPVWYPYTRTESEILQRMVLLLYRTGIGGRIQSLLGRT